MYMNTVNLNNRPNVELCFKSNKHIGNGNELNIAEI